MKFRKSFVSNSSSCSFVVVNKTKQDLDYSELVKDLRDVIDKYLGIYGWEKNDPLTDDQHEELIKSAKKRKYIFKANSEIEVQFGDNAGEFEGMVGSAVDYIIRDVDFESDKFSIHFLEMLH